MLKSGLYYPDKIWNLHIESKSELESKASSKICYLWKLTCAIWRSIWRSSPKRSPKLHNAASVESGSNWTTVYEIGIEAARTCPSLSSTLSTSQEYERAEGITHQHVT